MRLLPRAIAAGLLGVGAAALVACGESNGLLSSDQGSALGDRLNAVSSAVADGRCAEAQARAVELERETAALPATVDRKLRSSLQRGAQTVAQRAALDCRTGQTTAPSTATAPTTPTTPTSTATTPTAPSTTTTPSTPTTPTTPARTSTQSTTPQSPGGASTGAGTGQGEAGANQGAGNGSGGATTSGGAGAPSL